jgi:nucleotide-binding universal stress UspA family protein
MTDRTEDRTATSEVAREPASRIVVGVDGSPTSIAALGWAARQAELTGSAIDVVATWEWPTAAGWAPVVPSGYDPSVDVQKVVDQALGTVGTAHPDVHLQSRVVEGHPAPVLVEASRGAALLVVGNRGHGEFAGMLIGSVSQYCVTQAHCPVLVFRTSS